MPKRLLALHLHRTEPVPPAHTVSDGTRPTGHPPSRVTGAQWAFAGTDSTRVDRLMRAMRLPLEESRRHAPRGDEWANIYPISEVVDVRLLPTKPLEPPPVAVLPYVRLVGEDTNVLTAADGGGAYRDVTFEVFTERPCWGLLNLTASADSGILSWSITPQKWARGEAQRTQIVRWTSQRWGAPWTVTVRLAAGAGGAAGVGAQLTARLHVDYLADTPNIKSMVKKVPAWGTMTYQATTFISEYTL
jgi:hypothetical protein